MSSPAMRVASAPVSFGVDEIMVDDAWMPEPDEMLDWAARLGGRYMGADRAAEYGKRNAVPEESLVRAKITKVLARADIAGS